MRIKPEPDVSWTIDSTLTGSSHSSGSGADELSASTSTNSTIEASSGPPANASSNRGCSASVSPEP